MTTIHYVEAPPGSGKTTASLKFMQSHITSCKAKKQHGYIFYVAPTKALLRQTRDNLEKMLSKSDADKYLHYVASGSDHTVSDNVLNVVASILNWKKGNGLYKSGKFVNGSVLLITHATFLALRRHEIFEHTTVIFDESRQWVDLTETIEYTSRVKVLMNKLLILSPINGGKIMELSINPDVSSKKRKTIIERVGNGPGVDAFLELVRDLTPPKDGSVNRMRVFGVTIEGSGGKHRLMRVSLPSYPFHGFAKAYVMSDNFSRSQMYHLLDKEGQVPTNATRAFIDGQLGKGFLSAALERIEANYSQLTIVPLLNSSSMPSKSMNSSNILINRDRLPEVQAEVLSQGLKSSDVRGLAEYLREPNKNNKKGLGPKLTQLHKAMTDIGYVLNPLEWQVEASAKIVAHWRKTNKCSEPALLLMNKDPLASLEVNANTFQKFSTGKVEGRNDFMDNNAVVFLAGINPNPLLKSILKFYLPNYDIDEEFILNKLVQSIGRGCIRNQDKVRPMLAVVPTLRAAKRLAERYGHLCHVDTEWMTKLGNYTDWTVNNLRSSSKEVSIDSDPEAYRERARHNSAKHSAKHYWSQSEELRKIVNRVKYLTRKLKSDPKNKKIKKQLAEAIAAREALTA